MTYTRKIQKIGESLFVSLPKAWVERMQLNRGDAVRLVEHPDGSIAIYPEIKKEDLKQITLDVDIEESTRSLRRRITGAYVDGFDIIKLKAANTFTAEQQNAIREITEALFGLETIQVTSNSITIQCLLTKMLPIENTIQTIHTIIKSMFSETISALRERNPEAAKGVIMRTRDVKRLSLVVHRLLRSLVLFPTERTTEMKPIDSVDFLRVIDRITEISGNVKKIAGSIIAQERSFPNSILEPLLKASVKVLNLYDWSIQALMSKDVWLANRVLDEKLERDFDGLWDLLLKAEEKAEISGPIFSYVHRIIDNLRQIYIYTLEMAEIAIDRAEELSEKEE
ncbi:MAG: AbrB/MazE/SpoVT family DNA-binding domain-containing protein [Candidatus Bathyarchaeia archaeon]